MDSYFRQARSNLQNPGKASLKKQWLKKVRVVSTSFCISKVAGFHLTEAPLAPDQVVEELEDHYRIEATLVDRAMLDRWLLGFGGGCLEGCETEAAQKD